MGRRKIEIERIVDKHDRFICFSKRRKGLFKKANDLVLEGFRIIILVFSKSGNVFVYGSQNAKEVIKRFLNNSDATNGAESSNAVENLFNEMILTSETAERTEENYTSGEHSVHSAERTEKNDTSRSLNNSDATNGAGSSNAAENLINEMILANETAERTEENYTSGEHSVHSAERTEENNTSRSETGERSKENDDITRTVTSEDSLNSILTESKHFWWNSSVENLSWKNLLQFKSAIEDLLSRLRTKANSMLVEQNFLSGFT